MRRPATSAWAACLLSVLAAGPAWAQDMGADEPPGTMQHMNARSVLQAMHQKNGVMMELSQLALDRAAGEDTRDLAERALRDHRMGDRRVTALAAELGVELTAPAPLAGMPMPAAGGAGVVQSPRERRGMPRRKDPQQAVMQQLHQAQGTDFDRLYLQTLERTHSQVIAMLTQASNRIVAPQVVELIERLVPILDQHRDLAILLQRELA